MKNYDCLYYPYNSRRMVKLGKNGMVATSQPLAAQAGLDILRKGGNAVDAAIATAVSLTVLEPTSNGIGGDSFAILSVKDKLYGLNSSGPAPTKMTIEAIKEKGYEKRIPDYGLIPVTVPGAPASWIELWKKFGSIELSEIFKPAIEYAKKGYPVSPILSKNWEHEYDLYYKLGKDQPEYEEWFNVFAPEGKAPKAGEVWGSKDMAKTLELICKTEGRAFYSGVLAEKIDAFFKKYKGFLRGEDLTDFKPEWVEPISVNYRGYDIWEIPPNGQGMIALMALNILKGFDFKFKDDPETYHKQIEAMKLAFTDGKEYITDRNKMKVSVESLLSESYAKARRDLIKNQAISPKPGRPNSGGTVYLATADKEGNMVSFIQSNYKGFGSGVVVPETGIAFQNRGYEFSLDSTHSNALEPGKRTYHTIIPGFITKDNKPLGPFGVMGGYMQPQGHLQVAMNLIDFNLNPQSALDAPRWQWIEGKTVGVEKELPEHLIESLLSKGHDIKIIKTRHFGRGQIIVRNNETGVLIGGTEKRTDGEVAAY